MSILIVILIGIICTISDIEGNIIFSKVKKQPENKDFKGLQMENNKKKTKVILNLGLYQTRLKEDNSFKFVNIPDGQYILEVYNPYFMFEAANLIIDKGQKRIKRIHPLSRIDMQEGYGDQVNLRILDRIPYFQVKWITQKPKGFSIWDLVFHPYGMMLIMVLGMTLCYKKFLPVIEEQQRAIQEPDKKNL